MDFQVWEAGHSAAHEAGLTAVQQKHEKDLATQQQEHEATQAEEVNAGTSDSGTAQAGA